MRKTSNSLVEASCQKSAYVFVYVLQSCHFRPPAVHNPRGPTPNQNYDMTQSGQCDSAEPLMIENTNCHCHRACLPASLLACLFFCFSARLLACFAACLPACSLACFCARSCPLLGSYEHIVLLIRLVLIVFEGYAPMLNLASNPPMHFRTLIPIFVFRCRGGGARSC